MAKPTKDDVTELAAFYRRQSHLRFRLKRFEQRIDALTYRRTESTQELHAVDQLIATLEAKMGVEHA